MAITVVVHVKGQEAIVAEIEELPDPGASFFICINPRTRSGKPVVYIEREATRVIFPWHFISFVETMPSEGDQVEYESFFRD